MGKLVPIILALIGLGGGVGTGLLLRPEPAEIVAINPCGDMEQVHVIAAAPVDESKLDYVKMNNQFVIPVVKNEAVSALVVLSLSIEVTPGGQELIYEREPKLRDAFLQVMFDHANSGGFEGEFTNGRNMTILRDALQAVAVSTLGAVITDVLIVDIVRQDV